MGRLTGDGNVGVEGSGVDGVVRDRSGSGLEQRPAEKSWCGHWRDSGNLLKPTVDDKRTRLTCVTGDDDRTKHECENRGRRVTLIGSRHTSRHASPTPH